MADGQAIHNTSRQNLLLLPANYSQGEIVEVTVGDNKRRTYKIHKDLLISKSPYFEASLKDCWNGKSNEIPLTHDNPDVFEVFVHWVYTGSLPDSLFEIPGTTEVDYMRIGEAYRFFDKLMINQVKNEIMDAVVSLQKRVQRCFTLCVLHDLKKADLSDTQLYRLVLHDCVRNFIITSQNPGSSITGWSKIGSIPGLAMDILENIRNYNAAPWGHSWERDKCEYHDHSNGSACE